MTDAVQPGMNEAEVRRGTRFTDAYGEVRVLAVADGYAMCRRPMSMPFVYSVRDVRAFLATEATS